MNSIPIVTVDDLASNAFQKSSGKIDFKLSKKSGNGLKLDNDGLSYSSSGSSSGFQRILLGRMGIQGDTRRVKVEDVEISLRVENLGSDGSYLYIGAMCQNVVMRLSSFNHADDDNSGRGDGVEYASAFIDKPWAKETQKFHISYKLGGVNKAILISRTRIGDAFYIWADVLSILSSDSGGGVGDGKYSLETNNEVV